MISSCDSLIHNLQTPLGNRPLCFRTTVAGRGLFLLTATMRFTEKQLRNFWKKVNKADGCWNWTAGKTKKGYGHFGVNGKLLLAHRVSWEISNGQIPHDGSYHGICVLHRCDNPACVNPSHLFLGTNADNNRDKAVKGRCNSPVGEAQGLSKLTADKVRQIRRLNAVGDTTLHKLGATFGVHFTTIHDIVRGRTWKHETTT